jgi:hypothetical protein
MENWRQILLMLDGQRLLCGEFQTTEFATNSDIMLCERSLEHWSEQSIAV